ncbi:unnamed protein product [Tuber melanosporum]|uniref:(Perigord truffle) hypothetical protein n=1 Tax=Tuber melanosporum (strain Mel28) TaxID=656061 RepID=D5G600_TUBMM|nr:uncharacterized protein GSTUM_00001700001 [Tuber melanosporum]CAZ79943.1 unnamed protein product [Tuber melanosporum]
MRQHSKLHLPLPKPPSEDHEPRQGSEEEKKNRWIQNPAIGLPPTQSPSPMSRPRAQGPIFHPITQQRPTYITPVIEEREGGEDG